MICGRKLHPETLNPGGPLHEKSLHVRQLRAYQEIKGLFSAGDKGQLTANVCQRAFCSQHSGF